MARRTRLASPLGVAAICLIALGPAAAAEWESYASFTYQRDSIALPDGRTITTFTNAGAYQNVWPDRTTAGTLTCSGKTERATDGVEVDIYCEHVDADGDRYYQHSHRSRSDPAGGAGHEVGLGGTGKHAGREWTCTYDVTFVSDSWAVVRAKCSGDPPTT